MYKFTKEIENKYRGYSYLVMASEGGWRCGYVRIPSTHYLYRKTYQTNLTKLKFNKVFKNEKIGKRGILPIFTASGKRVTMDILFNVHGSITFSGTLNKRKGWWIGFDCTHSGDAKDTSIMSESALAFENKFSFGFEGVLWDKEGVEKECKSLIDQIIKYFDN